MAIFDILATIGRNFPSIKGPLSILSFKDKVYYTLIIVVLYYALFSIDVIGVRQVSAGLDFLQIITASRIGSFLTLGIGPIVLASIFLQLLSGAGIINVNLRDPAQKVKFHEAQRTITVLIALFEAVAFSTSLLQPNIVPIGPFSIEIMTAIVAAQLILGALIVMYMDEVITKYGIGSGISLFIAQGVSLAIVGGIIETIFGDGKILSIFAQGGASAIGQALIVALPLFSTIAIFLAVAYGEGTKVKLPLSLSFRGHSQPLMLPMFYVSNIPVIFAAALLLNVQLFAIPIGSFDLMVGDTNIVDYVAKVEGNQLVDGFLYYITPIRPNLNILAYLNVLFTQTTPFFGIPEWVHAVTYVLFLSIVSIIFGLFWVETYNMDAKSVAGQLYDSGAGLKGFRVDRRLLEKRLDEYITPLTVLGSFSVGFLAGIADLTGSFGTGTGILLTVGILYRLYTQIKEGLEIYFPGISTALFGK